MKLSKYFLALCIGIILANTRIRVYEPSAIAQTKYGKVEGLKEDNISIYKGIPFAEPPVGEFRWKAPQPPASWKGVKKCTAFSASPFQPTPVPFQCWTEEFIAPPSPLSEDCLYLNIWTGAVSSNEKRPVLVWIYGGGFNSGSAACDIYDGKEYAKNGIVFVSINYRVGALGFMAHPELTQEGIGSSGNYGLMDQVAALKWVHENISGFGGDPSTVTIAGQSAGAMSVNALMASPLAKGLFRRAISESGGLFGALRSSTLADGERTGMALQEKSGAKTLEALRAMPADSILRYTQGSGALRFGPIRDGIFLPVDLDQALKQGKVNQVDFLSGWVTGDGTLFGTPKISPDDFIRQINDRYGKKGEKLLELLPHGTAEQAAASQLKLNLISFAVLSPHQFLKYNSKPGYIYEFSHVPADKPGFPNYGAFHTSEVPYALHTLHLWKRPWQPLDLAIENNMSTYWINFIRSGNPNGPNLPEWKPYNTGTILEIGNIIQGRNELYTEILQVLSGD